MLKDKLKYGKFFSVEILFQHKRLWLLLSLLSIMSIWDISNATIFKLELWIRVIYAVAVGMVKGTLLFFVCNWCWRQKILRSICCVLIFIYAIFSMLNFVGFVFYEFGLTRKMMFIVAQTTLNEIRGFIPGLFYNLLSVLKNPLSHIYLILIILLFYGIKYVNNKFFGRVVLMLGVVGIALFVCYCFKFTSGRSAHSLLARVVKYGIEVYDWNCQFEQLKNSKKDLPDKWSISSQRLASNVVVVLGESASRDHHSIYGYSLPTTPRLDLIKDSLFVFTDVIGSSASTTGNMERILSFKEDDLTTGDGLGFPLVIDYFNEVGYKTYWLSNQERTGSVSNTSGVMAMNSHVVKYVGAENSEDALAIKFDEVLLPYLCGALSDTAENKMIFLHLYGSHVEFSHRYPSDFQHFEAKDELLASESRPWLDEKMAQRRAEYDNSIRYTDYILSEIIEKISECSEPSIMIYFSDHGENVYEDGPFSGRREEDVEVPYIVYMNDAYLAENTDVRCKMEEALDKPFSTANFVYMLMTMTGSSYRYYNSALDVLSPDYMVRPRYVDEKIWKYEHVID